MFSYGFLIMAVAVALMVFGKRSPLIFALLGLGVGLMLGALWGFVISLSNLG